MKKILMTSVALFAITALSDNSFARAWNKENVDANNEIMKKKWDNEEYICKNGYKKLQYKTIKEIM